MRIIHTRAHVVFYLIFFDFLIVIFLLVNVEKWITKTITIFSGIFVKNRQISHYFYPHMMCLTMCILLLITSKERWTTHFLINIFHSKQKFY